MRKQPATCLPEKPAPRGSEPLFAPLFLPLFSALLLFAAPAAAQLISRVNLGELLKIVRENVPPYLASYALVEEEGEERVKLTLASDHPIERAWISWQARFQKQERDLQRREDGVYVAAAPPGGRPFAVYAKDEKGNVLAYLPAFDAVSCDHEGFPLLSGIEQEEGSEDLKVVEVKAARDKEKFVFHMRVKGRFHLGWFSNPESVYLHGYGLAFLHGLAVSGYIYAPALAQVGYPPQFFGHLEQGKPQIDPDVEARVEGGHICLVLPLARFQSVKVPYFRVVMATAAATSIQPFRIGLVHRSNFAHLYFSLEGLAVPEKDPGEERLAKEGWEDDAQAADEAEAEEDE